MVIIVCFPFESVAKIATSYHIRYALGHETCELALERLECACTPALRDGQGRRVGKDFVFAVFQPIEDALRGGGGGGLRDLEAAVHIRGVRGQDAGSNPNALDGPPRTQ